MRISLFPQRKQKAMPFMTVMACPDNKCEHVWQASDISRPCPKCGNTNVIPVSNWNLDGEEVLSLGKLPKRIKVKAVNHG